MILLIIFYFPLIGSKPSSSDENYFNDLPLKFHPAAVRASAVFDTPNGVMGATG